MAGPIPLKTFVDGLEAMTITGVVRRYIHGPPAGATTAPDEPALFIYNPKLVGVGRLSFNTQGGTGSLQAQLAIVVKAVAQDYQARNFDKTVEMADALEEALEAAACAIGGVLGWDVDVTNLPVAGTMYWVVLALVTGSRY